VVPKPTDKRFGRGTYTKLKNITLPTMELPRVFGERSSVHMNGNTTDINVIKEQRRRRIVSKLQDQELDIMVLEGEKEVIELSKEVEKHKPKGNTGEAEAAATLVAEGKISPEEAVRLARENKGFVIVKPGADGKRTNASDTATAVEKGMNVALNTAEKIAEIGKGKGGGGDGKNYSLADVSEFVSAKVDVKISELKGLVTQALNKGNTKSPDVVDAIKQLKELGVIQTGGGGSGQTTTEMLNIQKEMRKTDKAFLLALKKLELETTVKGAELEEQRRRTDILGSGFKRIGRAIGKALEDGDGEEEFGVEQPRRKKTSKKVTVYKCSECGSPISVPPDTNPGTEVACAKCGAKFEAVDPEGNPGKNPGEKEKPKKERRTVYV